MWLLTRGGCGRPDGIGTVLHEEWDSFLAVKDRLRRLVENQLTNFRFSILAVLAMKTGVLCSQALTALLITHKAFPIPTDNHCHQCSFYCLHCVVCTRILHGFHGL